MLETHGMILEGRKKIRLRQVPGVAGLCEKAKVGQLQFLHHFCFILQRLLISLGTNQRVAPEQKSENSTARKDESDVEGRFSHFFTAETAESAEYKKMSGSALV